MTKIKKPSELIKIHLLAKWIGIDIRKNRPNKIKDECLKELNEALIEKSDWYKKWILKEKAIIHTKAKKV